MQNLQQSEPPPPLPRQAKQALYEVLLTHVDLEYQLSKEEGEPQIVELWVRPRKLLPDPCEVRWEPCTAE